MPNEDNSEKGVFYGQGSLAAALQFAADLYCSERDEYRQELWKKIGPEAHQVIKTIENV